jgi:alanine racemase
MAYITLNKENFFNNLDIIAQQSKGKDKIALVLKDNAYGHGLCEMASMAAQYGISKAVVRSFDEAKKIEEYFEYILVLAEMSGEYSSKIRYTLNSLASIKNFAPKTKVELKINSGMNRNGIAPAELQEAFEAIQKQGLQLEAVFTHHACADEASEKFYTMQKSIFLEVCNEAKELAGFYGIKNLRFHSCNSAALFRESNFSEDMARVGIAAYGLLEMPYKIDALKALRPVLSLYARRLSSHKIKVGESVGYGAAFCAEKPLCVSNFDIGYGDGFLRSCSNTYVTPDGIKIAGRISMDNSSFVTNKEEILLFNDAIEVARHAKTISYEVLTSLKPYLKRIIV